MNPVPESLPSVAQPTARSPIDFETDLGPLPLRGELPDGLVGALVRNGPNPVFPNPAEHWFVGDGMLHAFYLGDGQVHYRNRWIRTQRYLAERAAGKPLQNSLGQGGAKDDGVANTNVVAHASRLLALEEAHLPMEIDLATLGTRGPTDLQGGLSGPFTAHPKTDPQTGQMLFFGYGTPAPLSAGMRFGVIDADGRVERLEQFEAPYASMVHDFAISARHVIFPVSPLTGSMERARTGRPPFAWEPEYGTRVGLLPRGGRIEDMVWWRGPACYVFHVMNAFEADGCVHVDVMQFAAPPLFPRIDGTPAASDKEAARLVRWTFDLAAAEGNPSPEFSQRLLDPTPGEFPRIDERYTGRPYRHGWIASHVGEGAEMHLYCALTHLDLATATRESWFFAPEDRVSEAVFVPRSADAPEGEGWLLAVAWRAAEDRSDLVVFDAQHVARGPVCVAELPHRVPGGFHGGWFPAGFPGATR
ncbi:carotenoid oxygenase family protein [Variovorax saccharolyticus]|uniref:carotenoid oxygenase family protein n=1 Tax=Variovorax saccharolyticus TaxID=3053516 RepID=UPI002574AB4B|nr:carotenoid oxygenase family protein [Variovorax sp. J31P216]MDM0027398.1 carotenoid oxygenase family protein [Variovorax sp. J31P216]